MEGPPFYLPALVTRGCETRGQGEKKAWPSLSLLFGLTTERASSFQKLLEMCTKQPVRKVFAERSKAAARRGTSPRLKRAGGGGGERVASGPRSFGDVRAARLPSVKRRPPSLLEQ